MTTSTTPTPSAPRIVTRDAFLLFGLSERYHVKTKDGIPSQWSRFAPHIGHIKGEVAGVQYGAITNTDRAGNFDYVCAVEVTAFPDEPAGWARLRVAPHTYAVFEHRSHISTISATVAAIWEHGLVEAGVRAVDGVTFERYDARFDPGTGLGVVEIWVPIAA